jgi:hypothetical protein
VNYRRVGPSRGAATYHTLELSSAFNPGFEEVIEVKYAVEAQEDDSGGPPAPEDDETVIEIEGEAREQNGTI